MITQKAFGLWVILLLSVLGRGYTLNNLALSISGGEISHHAQSFSEDQEDLHVDHRSWFTAEIAETSETDPEEEREEEENTDDFLYFAENLPDKSTPGKVSQLHQTIFSHKSIKLFVLFHCWKSFLI